MSGTASESRALRFALGHFEASTGIVVAPSDFEDALRSGYATPQTMLAVETHLNEADPAELANLVIDGVASFASLSALADRYLRVGHPNRLYLARSLS